MMRYRLALMAIGAAILLGLASCSSEEDIEIVAKQGVIHFAVMGDNTSKADIRRTANRVCRNDRICQVWIWADKDKAVEAARFMRMSELMSEEVVSARIAVLERNRNTGLDRLLVSCEAFPETAKNECF